MRIYSSVYRFLRPLFIPKSFKDGEAFEQYVEDVLFPVALYKLVHKTHDYLTNNRRYVETSEQPDFKFRCLQTGVEFYVECKLRNGYSNDMVYWTNDVQLERYLDYNKLIPVFVCIGFGNPRKPNDISFIPLWDAKYTGLFFSVLDKHLISPSRSISINSYFKTPI